MANFNKFLLILCFAAWCNSINAQSSTDTLLLSFNKYVFNQKDTLHITAKYVTPNKKQQSSTLQMSVENAEGKSAKYRWPLVMGQVSGDFVLPDSLRNGKYTITFAVEKRFFTVSGKIISAVKTPSLEITLFTANNDIVTATIPVLGDGEFFIKNWLFEKNATLILARSNTKFKGDLDIQLETLLDSAYNPSFLAVREFYIGQPPAHTIIDSTGKKLKPSMESFSDKENELQNVVVTGKQKSLGQKFNEQYSTLMFSAINERVFDFMSDPSAMSYPSVLSYLQGKVAGLTITRNDDGTESASWRGGGVGLYLDEIPVTTDQLMSLSMADVAIVKTIPPIFMGSANGAGGAIAIYTRKGGEEFAAKTNRHVFTLKGYTPFVTALSFK